MCHVGVEWLRYLSKLSERCVHANGSWAGGMSALHLLIDALCGIGWDADGMRAFVATSCFWIWPFLVSGSNQRTRLCNARRACCTRFLTCSFWPWGAVYVNLCWGAVPAVHANVASWSGCQGVLCLTGLRSARSFGGKVHS